MANEVAGTHAMIDAFVRHDMMTSGMVYGYAVELLTLDPEGYASMMGVPVRAVYDFVQQYAKSVIS